MKSTCALIGAYAALASAFTPGRHLHFPRSNGTVTAAPEPEASVTTLTVKSTQTKTIISCAPTVTNCPAGKPEMSNIPESDRQTSIVTEIVDLTTTVCPVAEASTISQQIIEQHNSASAAPSQTQGQVVQTSDIVSVKTITITLGSGDRKSTTTFKSTITLPAGAAETGSEETITTTATSTSTRTITITRAKPTNTAAAENNDAYASGNAAVSAGSGAVTVTVTAPASTVYVTLPCGATQGAPVATQGAPVVNQELAQKSSANGGDEATQPPAAEATATPCESDDDFTTTIEATITLVPYPANNGTATGAPAASGFARLRR